MSLSKSLITYFYRLLWIVFLVAILMCEFLLKVVERHGWFEVAESQVLSEVQS